MLSPQKIKNYTKKDVITYLQVSKGQQLDEKLQMAIGNWLGRAKKGVESDIPGDAANTYTGIKLHAMANTKSALIEQGVFTPYATYTIVFDVRVPEGKKVWLNVGQRAAKKQKAEADADADAYVLVVFSSENLLLNAYRGQTVGLPGIMCVDYTHRLTYEGFNMCVVGTISPSQHFKVIGFAVSSDETEATHVTIFKAIRKEVEAVVASRRAGRAASVAAAAVEGPAVQGSRARP